MNQPDDKFLLVSLFGLPVGLLLLLIVGPILRDGMFIDGLVYTNIAKNLYYGIGDLWHPSSIGAGRSSTTIPPCCRTCNRAFSIYWGMVSIPRMSTILRCLR